MKNSAIEVDVLADYEYLLNSADRSLRKFAKSRAAYLKKQLTQQRVSFAGFKNPNESLYDFTGNKGKYSDRHAKIFWWRILRRERSDEQLRMLKLAYLLSDYHLVDFWQRKDKYRAFREEVMRLWWTVLVVPELQRLGVSRHQSKKARKGRADAAGAIRDKEEVEKVVRDCQSKNQPRSKAMHKVIALCHVKRRQASRIVASFGWPGRAGRPSV